jgi:hypothetical protein
MIADACREFLQNIEYKRKSKNRLRLFLNIIEIYLCKYFLRQ